MAVFRALRLVSSKTVDDSVIQLSFSMSLILHNCEYKGEIIPPEGPKGPALAGPE